LIKFNHPGIHHAVSGFMHHIGTHDQIHNSLFEAPPVYQINLGGEPDMGLPYFSYGDNVPILFTHGFIDEPGFLAAHGQSRNLCDIFCQPTKCILFIRGELNLRYLRLGSMAARIIEHHHYLLYS
jgi:hypothetical protein